MSRARPAPGLRSKTPTSRNPAAAANPTSSEAAGADAMISLTPKAAEKLHGLLEKKGIPGGFLRVRVTAGGCSGLNLEFDLSDQTSSDDKIYETHGAKIVLDPKSEF